MKKRGIHLRILINNTLLCIETDEDKHKKHIKYDDNIRYDTLLMDFSGKYISIKYNPDKFIDNTPKNPFFSEKMGLLKNNSEKHIQRIEHGLNTDLIEIYRLFYNEN